MNASFVKFSLLNFTFTKDLLQISFYLAFIIQSILKNLYFVMLNAVKHLAFRRQEILRFAQNDFFWNFFNGLIISNFYGIINS